MINKVSKSITQKIKNKAAYGFSKKFIFSISIIYSILIIISSIIINSALSVNVEKTSEIIYNDNIKYHSRVLNYAIDNSKEISSVKDVSSLLKTHFKNNQGYMVFIIYKKGGDDNFFKVVNIMNIYKLFNPKIKIGQNVSIEKGNEILKDGFNRSTYDKNIYSNGTIKWQNIYQPVNIGKKQFLIHGLVSTIESERTVNQITATNRSYKLILFIITLIIVMGVIIITYLFYQNYSAILKGLASHFDQAAQGNYNIKINQTDDTDFNKLADSFNSFVDSIMDRKTVLMDNEEYLSYLKMQSDNLFMEGTALIKENSLDAALDSFKILEILRPESHAVMFNIGVIHAKQKSYIDALFMFEKALKIDPEHELSAKYKEKVLGLLNS